MAQCKQSPQEFIKNTFTPQIAVLTTELAEQCCRKNNLSFIDLLQPFAKLNNDVQYKEPSGGNIVIRNLQLSFLDVNTRPPQTTLARKFLNSSVSEAPDPRNKFFQVGDYKLDIPSSTPWYEAWRETFLRVQYPSDHEYTKHFLACVLVISSNDNNPIETINQLVQQINQMQNTAPGKLPKWFSANVLKYYVILQDTVEGNDTSATETLASLKNSYGAANCFLLRMNSRPPGSSLEHFPDPWSQFITIKADGDFKGTPESSPNTVRNSGLEIGQEASETKMTINYHPLSPDTEDLTVDAIIEVKRKPEEIENRLHGRCISNEDVEQIKLMIFEFTRSCLLPYVTSQMMLLNDVISNKKGVSKSLFSATKRWFSTNKPGTGAGAVNNLIYATDAPELQVRRLGDLYFMFGHYSAAFQAYHLAKRDYNTDQAWLYYAGALEMASLAAFMANDYNRKTFDYMEESINTYLNTCKMPQFATRATILSSECLKFKSMYGEAALHLIKMTSEESDLRSALLLEQAAYCFLQSKMVRKYAFHMVLAGHRYSKAAQRKHSLRSYKQAFSIYENTGWDLASDHIHYTIGRQANNLQKYGEAVESFCNLLTESSKQSAQQQALFLKEYLTILANKLNSDNSNDIPVLPVPQLESSSLKILLGPTRPLSTPGKTPALGVTFNTPEDQQSETKWNKLEEMIVTKVNGAPPMLFTPMVTLYSVNRLQKRVPTAIVNEPIQVQVTLVNALQTVLNLKEIYLIWTFENDDNKVSNEIQGEDSDNFVKTHVNKTAIIEGNQKLDVTLVLTPLLTGKITVLGLCYTVTTTDTIYIKGKKFIEIPNNTTKPNTTSNRLEIKVVPSAPCLQVIFSEINLDFLTNELQRISIDFQNTGSVPLTNVLLATSNPNLLSSCEFREPEMYPDTELEKKETWARKNHIISVPLVDDRLEPGKTVTMNMWVKAPDIKGPTSIDILIYYENVDTRAVPKYRLVRHSWNLTVQDSISLDLSLQESQNSRKVEELSMTLKATNLNKIHNSISTEVTLLNVGVLSRYWKLRKNIMTPSYINLNIQESAYIFLKSKRINVNKPNFSKVQLYTQDIRKHLHNLNNACLSFAYKTEQYHYILLNEQEMGDKNLYKDGMLFLQWQALVTDANTKKIVYGQNIIPLEINRHKPAQLTKELDALVVDISDTTTEKIEAHEMKMLQKRVVYSLHFKPNIEHNFEEQKLCVVPVRLLLHSIVNEYDVVVTIDLMDVSLNPQYLQTSIAHPLASNQYRWLGKSKIIQTMKPLSTKNIILQLAVANPGTFNLGARIKIFCNKSQESPILQKCELQSSLIVTDIHT